MSGYFTVSGEWSRDVTNLLQIITGSIARTAKRLYESYSEGDFEVFRPAGATCCNDGVKFGTDAVHSFVPNFTPSEQR